MGLNTPFLITLEDHGASSELVWIEALHVDDEELLGRFHELMPQTQILGLQSGAELELSVVDETDGGWPASGLADLLHEFDADFEVVEDETVEDADLWERSHSEDALGNDAEVTLTAHDEVVEVGSVGDARPWSDLLVGA